MPRFEEGNKAAVGHGRPKGSKGGQVRSKYLAKWEQVFEATNPIEKLTAVAEKDYTEFIRLGLAAMPKSQRLEVETNEFDSWTAEELEHFIKTGKYPDHV